MRAKATKESWRRTVETARMRIDRNRQIARLVTLTGGEGGRGGRKSIEKLGGRVVLASFKRLVG